MPDTPWVIEDRGRAWCPACRSIEPEQSPGPHSASPIRQGRVAMDSIIVGIDVSKDRLDVAVRPSGEAFVVERNARRAGGADRAGSGRSARTSSRWRPPAASRRWWRRRWRPPACRSSSSIRPRCAPSPRRSASAPRPTRSMPPSSPTSPRRPSPSPGRCPTKRPGCSPTSSPAAGRSSR